MSIHEYEVEQLFRKKGIDGTRVKPEHIDSAILFVHYHSPADTITNAEAVGQFVYENLKLITHCTIVLANGSAVTGTSTFVSSDACDAEIGREIAYQNARRKIWPFMDHLLKEHLHRIKLQESQGQA